MGHEYVKRSETFSTSQNGVVPKPLPADVTGNKVLRADGSWVSQSGGGGGSTTYSGATAPSSGTGQNNDCYVQYDLLGNIVKVYFKISGTWEEVPLGGGSSIPEVLITYNASSSGSSTYTVIESGLYLIIASFSYQGSASITLPAGKSAILEGDLINTNCGMRWKIVELENGDNVTLQASYSSWNAYSKCLYLLRNINITALSSVASTDAERDTTATLTPPATSDKYFVFGVCMGRTSSDEENRTDTTGAIIEAKKEIGVGVNTISAIYYGEGQNLPEVELYGYDGGGGFIVCLRI